MLKHEDFIGTRAYLDAQEARVITTVSHRQPSRLEALFAAIRTAASDGQSSIKVVPLDNHLRDALERAHYRINPCQEVVSGEQVRADEICW